jgi:ribosomal protein S6--L-glutamate ligase
MHLGILSGGTGWHVQDLLRAANEAGHTATHRDFRNLASSKSTAEHDCDAWLVRTMPAGSLEQIVFRMDWLQTQTAPVFNPPKALETCVDKFLCTARLSQAGLPVPRTITCESSNRAMEAFGELGGDIVVKPLFGSEGRGMLRISERELAWRTFRAIEQTGGILYLQEFVQHPGWDVRVFVIGERIVGAMKRSAKGDWRTNVAQGGTAERFRLAPVENAVALNAARATGATIAGIDLIQDNHGEWLVLEVNAVPGWKALAPTCGIDVAREIVDFVAGHAP